MWYSIVIAAGKRLAALGLAVVVLWQVTEHSGPTRGRAVVHVATLPGDLVVDENVYRVADLHETPIICELRPGRHTAQLLRGKQVLYREDFMVSAGDEVILTAWDQFDDGRSPGRAAVVQQAPGPLGTGPLARHHALTTSVRLGTWFLPDF